MRCVEHPNRVQSHLAMDRSSDPVISRQPLRWDHAVVLQACHRVAHRRRHSEDRAVVPEGTGHTAARAATAGRTAQGEAPVPLFNLRHRGQNDCCGKRRSGASPSLSGRNGLRRSNRVEKPFASIRREGCQLGPVDEIHEVASNRAKFASYPHFCG